MLLSGSGTVWAANFARPRRHQMDVIQIQLSTLVKGNVLYSHKASAKLSSMTDASEWRNVLLDIIQELHALVFAENQEKLSLSADDGLTFYSDLCRCCSAPGSHVTLASIEGRILTTIWNLKSERHFNTPNEPRTYCHKTQPHKTVLFSPKHTTLPCHVHGSHSAINQTRPSCRWACPG